MEMNPKQKSKVTKAEFVRVQRALAGMVGGKSRSERKLKACRENAVKGGRPRKAQLEMRLPV